MKFKKIHGLLLIVFIGFISLIFIRYLQWGIITINEYIPSFDENYNLTVVGNIARYHKAASAPSYHHLSSTMNVFISVGLTMLAPLAVIAKLFGYSWPVISTAVFFGVNIPLVILTMMIIYLFSFPSSPLRRIFLSLAFGFILITNRLFYASSPTGGSFTHGVLGEPFSLLLSITSILLLYIGYKQQKYVWMLIAGIIAALAYETKALTLIFIIAELVTFIILIILAWKKSRFKFNLVSMVYFLSGFAVISFIFSLGKKLLLTPQELPIYDCWNKMFFLYNGSGFGKSNLLDIDRLTNNFRLSLQEIIRFFTAYLSPRWYESSITMVIIIIIFLAISSLIAWSITIKELINRTNSKRIFLLLIFMSASIIGSIWFFFIEDYHWIRHYYLFLFTGLLFLYLLFLYKIPTVIFDIMIMVIIAWIFVQYYNGTPFYALTENGSTYMDRLTIEHEDFSRFYPKIKDKKIYLCGDSIMDTHSFLLGINIDNNLLEDSRNPYPACDRIPDPRLRTIRDKQFYLIYRPDNSEKICNEFIETNKSKMKKIFDNSIVVFDVNL